MRKVTWPVVVARSGQLLRFGDKYDIGCDKRSKTLFPGFGMRHGNGEMSLLSSGIGQEGRGLGLRCWLNIREAKLTVECTRAQGTDPEWLYTQELVAHGWC